MKKFFLTHIIYLFWLSIYSQSVLKTNSWEMHLSAAGNIDNIVFKNDLINDTIAFFNQGKAVGPCFYLKTGVKDAVSSWSPIGNNSFKTEVNGIKCVLKYIVLNENPSIEVSITNRSSTIFKPQKAGIKLGVDVYMEKYPEWNDKYFPTLLRNEKTHFYGYLQTPTEHILALVSEQAVASWSVDYNLGYDYPKGYWFMGHRLESLNIDLLNQLPLPAHNPQNLYQLKPGETKKWTFSFLKVDSLSRLESEITKAANIPMIRLSETSCNPGDEIYFEVFGSKPQISITNDSGKKLNLKLTKVSKHRTKVEVILPKVGLYSITVKSKGKIATGILSAHQKWQWLLENARKAVLQFNQKPSTHAESWYGFFSAFIAEKYFPNTILDAKINERFEFIFKKLHDSIEVKPIYAANRIQNTSTFISELTCRYEARKNIEDLEKACKLADWMIETSQRPDGAYYNHGTVYTSVIYVAKSVLELALAEKELGKNNHAWQTAYERHYSSAKRAIDQLVASDGDFETEGQATFEDGMISCSALQVGMFALLQNDEKLRNHYTDFMLKILNSHNCLTQLKVPDARRRQGTMRFWEAQYDVMMLPNMFNSPHGWSAWRAYATYYAYLLTGDEKWLQQTFNAMGAFANLIDYKKGKLRWAFVVDPSVEVEQTCEPDRRFSFDDVTLGNPHPRQYKTKKSIIGEQYVDMISDWQTYNTQDNDVHEVFKCMGETVLANAFIVEQADGSYSEYNCRIIKTSNGLLVVPTEKQITHLHCSLKRAVEIDFIGNHKKLESGYFNWAF